MKFNEIHGFGGRFGILAVAFEWAICFPLLVYAADLCLQQKARPSLRP